MKNGHRFCCNWLLAIFVFWLVFTQSSAVAQVSANQFHKFSKALAKFHDEYGSYPEIFDESGVFRFNQDGNSEKFIQAIAGQTYYGERVALYGNKDSKRFYVFTDSDFSKTTLMQIVDQFGNADIILLIDHDGDGNVDIPDKIGVRSVPGKVHAYSRFEDGMLCTSTWGGLSEDAAAKFKEESDRNRTITSVTFTILAIIIFSAWWYVRDKIMD